MAEIKATDKMHSTNDEVKREDDFQDATNKKEETYDIVKELLDKTTEDVFSKAGFERISEPTSVYATGQPYGFGAEEGKYQIRLAGKTKSVIEKQIILGAKKVEAQISMNFNGNVLEIEYRTPESGFFRGVKPEKGDRKTYMVNTKVNLPIKDKAELKKELKNMFEDAAQKELSYLNNTRLGIEDRVNAGTTSMVDESIKTNNTMKNLTLKEIFSEDENDFEKIAPEEKNIQKVIDLNTQPIDDKKPLKSLLFDDEEENEEKGTMESVELEEVIKQHSNLNKEEMHKFFNDTMMNKFGTSNLKALTPVEKKELFNTIDKYVVSKEEQLAEMTTTGPAIAGSAGGFKDGAFAGSGGYNTKFAFKPVGELKKSKKAVSKAKQTAAEKAGAPFNLPVNDAIYENGKIHEGKDAINFEKSINEEKKNKFFQTPYAKAQNAKRPKVDKDYKIIPEKKDPFWTPVEIDRGYHPVGMPFVKPNSKEEWDRTSHAGKFGRDFDKLKRIGVKNEGEIKESESEKKQRLLKRKFISEGEQKDSQTNKRYIVCEKTSEEYERERWEKLSTFKLYESIEKEQEKKEENTLDNDEVLSFEQSIMLESENKKIELLSEETILVEKPDSKFGICHKFYKKDFLNEGKDFILDLNSMVFVKNPNHKL